MFSLIVMSHFIKWKGCKQIAISLVELVLELDPIGWNFHQYQCNLRACKKHSMRSMHINTPKVAPAKRVNPKINWGWKSISYLNGSYRTSMLYAWWESHVVEHFSQLSMCKREGPKSQIWSCIRDRAKNKFDGFDDLVYKEFAKLVVRSMLFLLDGRHFRGWN